MNNGHAHIPPVAYRDLDKTNPREQTGVKEIIEEIQSAYDRQCRELDSRDNLIELLRDELARKNEQLESYMRKTYEIAQQMKAVAQLCDEGRRLADIVERD
jgi:transcription elongation factor GreA-like protein